VVTFAVVQIAGSIVSLNVMARCVAMMDAGANAGIARKGSIA
jgi:hypothetical protein